jgi:hypothetical protein
LAEAKENKAALIELSSKMEAELVEEVDRLTSRVEMMECRNGMKEKLDKEIIKNHEQEEKWKRLNHEWEKDIAENSNLDAVYTKKKEECQVLSKQVKTVMVDVDRLSKNIGGRRKSGKGLGDVKS